MHGNVIVDIGIGRNDGIGSQDSVLNSISEEQHGRTGTMVGAEAAVRNNSPAEFRECHSNNTVGNAQIIKIVLESSDGL